MQPEKGGFLHSKACPEKLTAAMIHYRNFQFGWFIVCVFVIVIAFMTLSYIYQWGSNPLDIYGYVFLTTLFGLIILSFCGLTVTVDEEYIRIKFGIGLFSKKIRLSLIRSVEIVRYPVFAGYGIRILPKGILYNVSGRYAVEIKLTGKRDVIMIGTNDKDNLKDAIEKQLDNKDTF